MLSDYIPVYWPDTNQWSFPSAELEKYEDYVPEPQDIVLFRGHVVRGIPLVHFGTWGAVGVDVTGLLRKLVKEPSATCAACYRSKKTGAEVSAFFVELRKRYPKIEDVDAMPRDNDLNVPPGCIVARGGK